MSLPSRKITTIVGTGQPGYAGDHGSASQALLNEPFMCAFDTDGNLFIADAMNHCIRRVDHSTQIMTTIAGTGVPGYSGDGGPAIHATLNQPYALDIDPQGNLYVVDRLNCVIRKIDTESGIIDTIAGTGEAGYSGDNGPGITAQLREPNDCFVDHQNGLLIADIQDQRIRRLNLTSGIITTFAGNGEKARAGDGLPATEASILGARAVCMDTKGNTYICEREGNGIRKVDTTGRMSTFAGTGERGYSGDQGPALLATWSAPKAIRCDRHDNLIVVDTENHAIRRIDTATGVVTTIAGGQRGAHGDNGPASEAGLDRPHGCAIDTRGNILIADSNNHRIRLVQPVE